MGHKVHPTGFRIGVIRDWQAKWYADKHYLEFVHEDFKLREAIQLGYPEAGISQVEISRQANEVLINIYTSRPGVVIGRGGQRVDEMRNRLEQVIGKKVRLNIMEVHQPELDAILVAKTVAEQIERRVAYRRAMKQAISRTIQAGARGIRISCAGRLGGAEIARRQILHQGQVPLHTLRADIDYGFTEAHTKLGRIGVKVWIYRGDILPEPKTEELEEAEPATEPAAASVSEEEQPTTAQPIVSKIEEEPAVKPTASKKKKVGKEPATEPAAASVSEEEQPTTAQPIVSEIEEGPAVKPTASKKKKAGKKPVTEPAEASVSEEEQPAAAELAASEIEEESIPEVRITDVTAEEDKIS